jgi:hypothetical protein
MNFLEMLSPVEVMYIILALIVMVCTFYLWRLNEDQRSSISLIDLVSINGRLNERKFSRFGAWVVSTWGFIYLVVTDKLDEWYFMGYMGAWVANALIGKYIKDREGEETPIKKINDSNEDFERKL